MFKPKTYNALIFARELKIFVLLFYEYFVGILIFSNRWNEFGSNTKGNTLSNAFNIPIKVS